MIWQMEMVVTRYRAWMEITSTLSAMSITGRNISAMPTGRDGAMISASGTPHTSSRGTKSLPIHWNTGV